MELLIFVMWSAMMNLSINGVKSNLYGNQDVHSQQWLHQIILSYMYLVDLIMVHLMR